jgi:hypothetical protein
MRRTAALVLVALLPMSACGDGGETSGALTWKGNPNVIVPTRLPGDRVLRGEVINESSKRVVVQAKDLRVVDGEGRSVEASPVFLSSYLHSLYPPTRRPTPYPEAERRRLGQVAEIEPGKSVPLTVSWHEPKGPRTPVRIDYGNGSLPIP